MPNLALFVAAVFIAPLLTFLGGAFCGWLVGHFFAETFAAFLAAAGLGSLAPWQFGGMLGFIGAFFRDHS